MLPGATPLTGNLYSRIGGVDSGTSFQLALAETQAESLLHAISSGENNSSRASLAIAVLLRCPPPPRFTKNLPQSSAVPPVLPPVLCAPGYCVICFWCARNKHSYSSQSERCGHRMPPAVWNLRWLTCVPSLTEEHTQMSRQTKNQERCGDRRSLGPQPHLQTDDWGRRQEPVFGDIPL